MRRNPLAGFAAALALLAGLVLHSTVASAQATLWYNGDLNGTSALYNGSNGSTSLTVYDDFDVPVASGGWQVSSVFADVLYNISNVSVVVTTANWFVRSGVSSGDGGTLAASGSAAPVTLTATGNTFSGFTEYRAAVSGLNFTLAPGTYWLGLQPIGNSSISSFISPTIGTNAIGTPAGNDGNAFIDGTGPTNFVNTVTFSNNATLHDFSMGVVGFVNVPEPSTFAMALGGFGMLFGLQRLRRSTRQA